MTPNQMRELLRKQPFEPFRIHLADGTTLEIRYPRLNLVTEQTFVIGISDPVHPDPFIAERVERVGWEFVRGCEPISANSTT
jgi:hypothetical protein